MNEAAAGLCVDIAAEATKQRGRFLLALSGGDTPRSLYGLLTEEGYHLRINWSRTHVFWADERCVPADDINSNYSQAKGALLDHVNMPEENVHRIRSEMEPSAAALEYSQRLQGFADPPLAWPRLDLVLLGLGEDGHTASLFPGSQVAVTAPVLSVTAEYQGRPAQRVTMTPMILNAARRVVFLVSGERKSNALARALHANHDPGRLPTQRIKPQDGEVFWLVDKAAAGKLQSNDPRLE